MDKNFERLNKIYPNGQYALIPKYNEELWKEREYDSTLDTKAAINRWKTKPLTYQEACSAIDEGYRIGWIVPKGYVVIDIDNGDDERSQEYLERLLHKWEVKYSYNYTSRGIHILFKDVNESIKSESHMKCALNITVDTRANGTGYIILPTNDPNREWGEWNDFVEDIPYFMKPILKDNTPSFIGMVNGDGRNDMLFKWRSQLERSQKLNEKEVEKCIRIINENLLDEPLPNNELFKTVLRSRESIDKKLLKAENENAFNKLADEIISQYDIVSYYDMFYKFNGIYYKKIEPLELEKLIHFEYNKNITKSQRGEVIEFIKVKTQVSKEDFDKDWHKIAVKNGVLNLVTGEIEIANKTEINTIYIPWEYNPDPVYSPRIDQFMKDITGGDLIKMEFLYQIAGYCLLKKNLFQKFFIFQGEGGTGKSTFQELIHMMVGGDDNCSHIALANFDKDYYLAGLVSKLVNLDDDVVDGKMLENTGRFKSAVSGNEIEARQIYREPIHFIPYATLMFNCNRLPRIMDKTSGLYRRMVLVELNNKVEKPDPLFMNKVNDTDMEYFLFKAVEGIKTAIEEGHFRINYSEEKLINIFKRRQSAINEWVYENDICLGDLYNKPCVPLYKQFTQWCDDNGYTKVCTNFSFKEDLCTLYDMEIDFKAIEGKTTPMQVFTKRGNPDMDYRPF